MYVPPHFAFGDLPAIHDFMREFPFVTLVTGTEQGPIATHLPVMLDASQGEFGLLRAHMARPNPHWKAFLQEDQPESLVIFHGPHTYVSPRWYRDKPAVPTWNYLAVHAYGTPVLLDTTEALLADLDKMVDHYEPDGRAAHIITDDYKRKLAAGIVGFRITITRIDAKRKLGQNRSEADRASMNAVLDATQDADAASYQAYLRQHKIVP